jgi:hypothetical protein
MTALILLLLFVISSSGCNSQTGKPEPGKTAKRNKTTASSVPQMTNVAVYYLKATDNDFYLVREVHRVKKTPAIAKAALNELINGKPVTPGAYRVLPSGTKVLEINIDQGLATVNLSSEVLKANVGAEGEALGIASIVNTLTELPSIQKVSFMVDGQTEKAMNWWGHVGLSGQPFSRYLADVWEPAIWVTTPSSGQMITSPVKISGSARVFEATVSYRIKDDSGKILAQGYTNASEGAPGRGDFLITSNFETAGPGKGQVEVFWVSPKDGSEQGKVIIPVKWE